MAKNKIQFQSGPMGLSVPIVATTLTARSEKERFFNVTVVIVKLLSPQGPSFIQLIYH